MIDKEGLNEIIDTIKKNVSKTADQISNATEDVKEEFLDIINPEELIESANINETVNEQRIVCSDFISVNKVKKVLKHAEREFALNDLSRSKGKLYVSRVSNECLRKVLFMFFGLKIIDEAVLGNYAETSIHKLVGIIVHMLLEKSLGLKYADNVSITFKITDRVELRGRIDILYEVRNDKYTGGVVGEFKTIKSGKHEIHSAEFTGLLKHWQQTMAYAYMLNYNDEYKKYLSQPITFVQLLYISKDLDIERDYKLNLATSKTYERFKNIFSRKLEIIKESIETNKIPPYSTRYFINMDECRFCPYQSFCKNRTDFIDVTDEFFDKS